MYKPVYIYIMEHAMKAKLLVCYNNEESKHAL